MTQKKIKTIKNTNLINNKTRKNHSQVYTNDDYNSGDGMLTTVWGPGMWHYLHTMSFNYPVKPTPDEKKHYRDFIISLKYVLPCKYCRMNLARNFKQMPLKMSDMSSREKFSKYIYELHELVNKMLHKKSNLRYCDVRERYEHFRARCTDEKPKLFELKELKALKNKNNKTRKEKGCTEPLYGKKSKCIIKIVPQEEKGDTFQMDNKCIKTRE
uniref:thiol oxidase n=1 Tax=viral metagenome TaxID=1070528 RepID=A0A6C0KZ37_9ZZZZ